MVELKRAQELARAALGNLEAHRQRIDDLNVYPVPDGDTGTNLTLTVRAIVAALERSERRRPATLAREISRAALMGARGNSGVIFSQIVRGFADAVGERDQIDAQVIARAFRSASDTAYRAVREPVEGTMLTVIREMAEEAEQAEVQALAPRRVPRRIVARGEEAVARTPELLDKLREAGVVDAGGAGLLEIVRGLAAGVRARSIVAMAIAGDTFGVDAIHQELSEYRYCTDVRRRGRRSRRRRARRRARTARRLAARRRRRDRAQGARPHRRPRRCLRARRPLGDDPRARDRRHAPADAGARGAARRPRSSADDLETGVVVVAPGAGNGSLFEGVAATRIIEGGQTMNPSTEEIVAAVDASPATGSRSSCRTTRT